MQQGGLYYHKNHESKKLLASHETQSQVALKSARNMQWQNLNWGGGQQTTMNHIGNKDKLNSYADKILHCHQHQTSYDGLLQGLLKLCSKGLFHVSGDYTAAIFSMTESGAYTFTTCCKNPNDGQRINKNCCENPHISTQDQIYTAQPHLIEP